MVFNQETLSKMFTAMEITFKGLKEVGNLIIEIRIIKNLRKRPA